MQHQRVIIMAEKPGEQSIFLTALELATPGEREAYLRGACGNNAALHAAVADVREPFESRSSVDSESNMLSNFTISQPPRLLFYCTRKSSEQVRLFGVLIPPFHCWIVRFGRIEQTVSMQVM